MVYKKLHYFRNQKKFNNGLNGIFLEIRDSHICVVFKKAVIIFVNE